MITSNPVIQNLPQLNLNVGPGGGPAIDAVQKELRDIASTRPQYLAVPGRTVELYEVHSWAQVPIILKRLEAKAEVRLSFPEVPANNADVSKEQNEIRMFLSQRHNKPIQDMVKDLQTNIENSWLFASLTPAEKTSVAQGWVAKQGFNPHKNGLLAVTHVYTADHLTDPAIKPELLAKLAAAPTTSKVIFEVPFDPKDAAKQTEIRNAAVALETELGGAGSRGSITADCQVWVGNFIPAPSKRAATPNFDVFNTTNFFKRHIDGEDAIKAPAMEKAEYLYGKTSSARGSSFFGKISNWYWLTTDWLDKKLFGWLT